MPSVLRQLQAEWNALVPAAQAAGFRRVVHLERTLEPIAYRRERLETLRAQLSSQGINVQEILNAPVASVARAETALATVQEVLANANPHSFTFGVEIECISPRGISAVAQFLNDNGVACNYEGYNHRTQSTWKVVTDGSLYDYIRGCEVVSPVLRGAEGIEQLRLVCRLLKAHGCKVNRRCGYHVHVGAAGMPASFFRNLVKSYVTSAQAIESFLAPSRCGGNNGFCLSNSYNETRLNAAQSIDEVVTACGQSTVSPRSSNRYRKLNLQSYYQHKTVEFRQHQGTIEEDRAANWVMFCLRLCAVSRHTTFAASNVSELMASVGASSAEQSYFSNRAVYFSRQSTRARRAA